MGGWVETALGPGGTALQIGAAIVLIGIVIAVLLLFRRRRSGSFYGKSRQAKPRLTLLETANIDQRRQLILIRRDKVEHLLLIGGPSDIVVESGIAAGQGEQRLPAQDFAPAAMPRRDPARQEDTAQVGAKEPSKADTAKKTRPAVPGAAAKADEPKIDKSREIQPRDSQPREIQNATGKSQSDAPDSVTHGAAPQNPAAQALVTAGAVMAAGSSGQATQPSNAASANTPAKRSPSQGSPSQGAPTLSTQNLARDGAPVITENRTAERHAPTDGNGSRGPNDREHDRAQSPVPQSPVSQSPVPQSPVPKSPVTEAGPVQTQPTPNTAAAAGLAAGVAALTAAAGHAKSATDFSARQDTGPDAELKAPLAEKTEPLVGSEDTETMMRRAFGLREGEQASESPAPQSPAPGDSAPEEQAREQTPPDPSTSPALMDPPGEQTAAPIAQPPVSIPVDTAPAVAPADQEPERREPAPTDAAAPPVAPTPASHTPAPDAGQTASSPARTPPGGDSGMQSGELVSDLSKRLVSSDPGPMLSSLTGSAPGGSAAAAMAASVEAITSPRSEPKPVEANEISEPGEGGQTTLGDLAERLEEALSKQTSGTVLEQPVGNVLPEPTIAVAPEPVVAPQPDTPEAVTSVESSPLAAEFGFVDDSAPAPAPQGDELPAEAVGGDNSSGDGKSVIEFASRRKTNKESLEDEMARLLGELTGESAR